MLSFHSIPKEQDKWTSATECQVHTKGCEARKNKGDFVSGIRRRAALLLFGVMRRVLEEMIYGAIMKNSEKIVKF